MFAVRTDHTSALIDTTCRSSFRNLLDRPDFMRMCWAAFEACLEGTPGESRYKRQVGNRQLCLGAAKCIQEAIAASAPKRRSRADPQLRPPLVFRMKYTWTNGRGVSGKSRGTQLWETRSTASRSRWPFAWVAEQTVERYAGILGQ
jgi:hypothetical protein